MASSWINLQRSLVSLDDKSTRKLGQHIRHLDLMSVCSDDVRREFISRMRIRYKAYCVLLGVVDRSGR